MNFQYPTNNPQLSVRLHIERLVVDEALLAGGQAKSFQSAIESELARLLSEGGLIAHADTAVPSLTARNIQVSHQTRPAQLAGQVAEAIHATIGAAIPPASILQPKGGEH